MLSLDVGRDFVHLMQDKISDLITSVKRFLISFKDQPRKSPTRTRVEVELSDKTVKSSEKSVKTGFVVSSRALDREIPYLGVSFGDTGKLTQKEKTDRKEKAQSGSFSKETDAKDCSTGGDYGAKSAKCSVEIGYKDDRRKEDSDKSGGKETDSNRSKCDGQKSGGKQKCEVSVSIN